MQREWERSLAVCAARDDRRGRAKVERPRIADPLTGAKLISLTTIGDAAELAIAFPLLLFVPRDHSFFFIIGVVDQRRLFLRRAGDKEEGEKEEGGTPATDSQL